MPTTTAIPPSALNRLTERLSRESRAEVYFDRGMRGLYATDASLYQIEPLGVVVPRTLGDVAAVVKIAADEHLPILPRGAATSLSGQTVGAGDHHRLFQVSESDRHRRPRRDDGTRRAGRGARPAQCAPEAAGPDVRARRLDQRSGDDRRDDRQQLGRRPLAPLRQDGGPRALESRSSWPTARRRRLGPFPPDELDADLLPVRSGRRGPSRGARHGRRASSRRSATGFRTSCAGSAATTSMSSSPACRSVRPAGTRSPGSSTWRG